MRRAEMCIRDRPWHEKTLGQLFCDGSARAILEMLLAECELGGVKIVLNARGIAVERGGSGGFRILSSQGEFSAESLVVATGGLSIPKLGATGLGYELAAQFGLKVIEPRTALVPLVLGGAEAGWTALAGVAAEVESWEMCIRDRPVTSRKWVALEAGEPTARGQLSKV